MVDPNDPSIPEDLKADFAGKVFVVLLEHPGPYVFNEESRPLIPAELLNLKVENEELVGDLDHGNHCLSLDAKMIELVLKPEVDPASVPPTYKIIKVGYNTLITCGYGVYIPRLHSQPSVESMKTD